MGRANCSAFPSPGVSGRGRILVLLRPLARLVREDIRVVEAVEVEDGAGAEEVEAGFGH
jgi:hypothetical protein